MRKTVAVSLAMLLLLGCVNSLQPAYFESDLVFDASLTGEWVVERETWTVTRGEGKSYRIQHADETGRSGIFAGHLFRIGTSLFLDLTPLVTDLRDSEFFRSHRLSAHTFYRVLQTSPEIQLASMNGNWLKEHLRKSPNALKHEVVGGEIVITAPTGEIQAFIMRNLATEDAFDRSKPLRRM